MKIFSVILLIGCLAMVGCSESGTTAETITTAPPIADTGYRVEANITGMDCHGCVGQVCAATEQITGVTNATANLDSGKVTVTFKEGSDADVLQAEIETVITELNNGKYTVTSIAVIASETQNTFQDRAH